MRIYGLKKIHFKSNDEKNAYSIASFFSFHRYLENNKINGLDSGAFNNLPDNVDNVPRYNSYSLCMNHGQRIDLFKTIFALSLLGYIAYTHGSKSNVFHV